MFDRLKRWWKKKPKTTTTTSQTKRNSVSIRRSFSILRRTSLKPLELQQIDNLGELLQHASISEGEQIVKTYWAKILIEHQELSVHELQERLEYYSKDLRHHFVYRGRSLEKERKRLLSINRKKKKPRGNNDSCGNKNAAAHEAIEAKKSPPSATKEEKDGGEEDHDAANSDSDTEQTDMEDDGSSIDDEPKKEKSLERQSSGRRRSSMEENHECKGNSVELPAHRRLVLVPVDGTKGSQQSVAHACQLMTNLEEDHLILLATYNDKLPATLLNGRTNNIPQNAILILKHTLWKTGYNILKRNEKEIKEKSPQLDFTLLIHGTDDHKRTVAKLADKYRATHIVVSAEMIANNSEETEREMIKNAETVLEMNMLHVGNRPRIIVV